MKYTILILMFPLFCFGQNEGIKIEGPIYDYLGSKGTSGQVMRSTGTTWAWATPSTGTVTSVGLSMPGVLFNTSVTNSPVTTSGTLTPTLATQTANTILAGPTSGGAETPTFRALGAADIPDLAATYWKLGGQALVAPANVGSTSSHRVGWTTNGVGRWYMSADGRWYQGADVGAITDMVFSPTDSNYQVSGGLMKLKGLTGTIGTTGNNTFNLVVFDTTRAKLTATNFEYENNRTGNQSIILADRTTAPAVGGYSSIDIGLANTVTTSLRSYHEVSGTGYSTGLHTLSSGITNTTPAWYATHLNKFAINRDTATWCLDVKGSGTDALIARFEANDENAFVYVQNSNTGSTSADGLTISMANTDATINNRESGSMTISTGNTPHITLSPNVTTFVEDTVRSQALENVIEGHIVGDITVPTIAADTAAGTGATVDLIEAESSDIAGRFTLTTGSGSIDGNLSWVTVTFDNAYSVKPIVLISAEDVDAAAALPDFWVVPTTAGFSVFASGDLTGLTGTELKLAYHVIQGNK